MKVDVLGVKIDALTKQQVLQKISQRLEVHEQTFIVTPYSESIVSVQKNPEYKKILNSADISLADGIGVLWAANYLESRVKSQELRVTAFLKLVFSLFKVVLSPHAIRSPIPERISGSSFVWDLAALAEGRGESIFLLGGFGDVTEKVSENLKKKFSNLKIAGVHNGKIYKNLVDDINSSGADYLFVALGPERQEKWLFKNRKKLSSKLLIGLGGTFDYIAAKRPNTPKFMRFRGLEWLWRLFTQPWRVPRIVKGITGLVYYSFKQRNRV